MEWASLVVQLVKNLAAMQETWVQSLGPENLLEKEMATHSRIVAWKVPWTEEPGRVGYNPWGHESQTGLSDYTTTTTLKIELSYDPAVPLLSIYSKEVKIGYWSNMYTTMVIAALFTVAKIWKQSKCPSVDEWIKMWPHTNTHTIQWYSALRGNKILLFAATWIDLEGIILNEISQRKTNTVWSHLCMAYKRARLKEIVECWLPETRGWGS